jgi:hypothetical protein
MLREDVIFFLKTNPDPIDADVHVWAEENGYDVHEVETEIYKLATKFVKFLTGGRANDIGIDEEDVEPEELKLGIQVEKEHIDDVDVQKRIALDHLSEDDRYYSRLLEFEKTFESK